MTILNDEKLMEINPGIVSPDGHGDMCLACMRRIAEAAYRETLKKLLPKDYYPRQLAVWAERLLERIDNLKANPTSEVEG